MANIQEYENLVNDAVEVVEFQLIRRKTDLEHKEFAFHPAMSHQIFGENESIFGYQDLVVRILYTAGPLQIYVGVEYSKKVEELSNGVIKADDVIATIAQQLPDGCYFVNMDEFLKTLDKADKFQPFGEKISEFKYKNPDSNEERLFEFYQCDHRSPTAFFKFFGRLQTFVLWFVDAASYIDVDDPQWNYFICYEKYKNENGVYQYATIGYTTVYEYYAYPQHIRPRISQMLVLPPFQKMGIGTQFLETIYKYYQAQKSVIDITVEDPSDDFQRMRNYIDARLCKDLKSFSREELKKGFSKEMAREARETFKLNPLQCRKVYEILRLYYTNVHDKEDYTAYRLDVKKRLNAYYHKQMMDIKKMEKKQLDTTWLVKRLPTMQLRMEQLKEEYEQVESSYRQTIEKLKSQ